MLSVYLIEGSRISKTAIPNLIDGLDRMEITLALRSASHRLHRPPPHAILMLVGKFEDLVAEKLIRPPALPTQRARSDLYSHHPCQHIMRIAGSSLPLPHAIPI